MSRESVAGAPAGRWLILGARGYLGAAVAAHLAELGAAWQGTRSPRAGSAGGTGSAGSAGSTGSAGSAASIHSVAPALDITDRQALLALLNTFRPTVILNATGHRPGASEEEMREVYVRGTESLLAAVAEALPASRVVLIGSAAEYGNAPPAGPSVETDPPRPFSLYGRLKAEQSALALGWRAAGVRVQIGRVFNLTGPGQGPHLLAGALLKRLGEGERRLEITVANHLRDWLDVRDAAAALVRLAGSAEPPAVVNICSAEERTVGELAAELCRLAGAELAALPGEISAHVLWRSAGCNRRLTELGWQRRFSFAESLHDQWRAAGSPRLENISHAD